MRKLRNRRAKLINRCTIIVSTLLILSALPGCASKPKAVQSNIGYLDGKYRVCRENCPAITPKELDDTQPLTLPAAHLLPIINQVATQPPAAQPPASVKKSEPIKTQVHFEFGKSTPTHKGMKELQQFAEVLAKNNAITAIEVVGGTDDIGTRHYNSKLALERASFVAGWLKDNGVSSAITITTKEECCRPAPYDKSDEGLEAKRRVSIVVHE